MTMKNKLIYMKDWNDLYTTVKDGRSYEKQRWTNIWR